ncbi:MAG: hypothetical protein JWL65_3211 [Gammaproteobacteria bacterium]|nr:hypothetical protein [Gammaproteobacteria bacterium]
MGQPDLSDQGSFERPVGVIPRIEGEGSCVPTQY